MKYKNNLYLFVLILFLVSAYPATYAQDYTLPTYYMEVAPEYLEALYANPFSDVYYPAVFFYNEFESECEVKFRGRSSLTLPKKSWRIKFGDDSNIFNAEKINLNAEYRDYSIMRNYLALKLFQHTGYPAPKTEHISLMVNDEYMGVFVQVEEIDEYYLQRNERIPNTLYKAKNHAASMSPITHYNTYPIAWDKKMGDAIDYSDIQRLFSKLLYCTKSDFEIIANEDFNIDNVLHYFALEFAIVSLDCFTKNLYLYLNPEVNDWEIFPWDNDASFGNDWDGVFHPDYSQVYDGPPYGYETTFHYQILFQRLMEYEDWYNEYIAKLNNILTEGFSYLNMEIDSTYNLIKNDVYQDTFKIGTNSDFDEEIEVLHNFLSERASFLDDFHGFERIGLSNYYCSNAFPNPTNSEIVFQVTSEQEQLVSVKYAKGLNFSQQWDNYIIETLPLFDDGNHNDFAAGDLIYGNSLDFSNENLGLYPFCFNGSNSDYPANSFFQLNNIEHRTNTFLINMNNTPQDISECLEIGDIYRIQSDYFVEIRNNSPTDLDLSYCSLQVGAYYQKHLFPEFTLIGANDTLIVSSNKAFASYCFDNIQTIGNIFFEINIGDTVKLLSPVSNAMASKRCDEYLAIDLPSPDIIITEINYNSAGDYNPGDWVEFYNLQEFQVDISDWYFKDEDDSHIYIFPSGTILEPHGYLVLCRELASFHDLFPDVNNYSGSFDFGLSGSGELIRLYETSGSIIDSVMYDDNSPWPEEPDGEGPTLELINLNLDNSLAESWAASSEHGTPGNPNITSSIEAENTYPAKKDYILHSNYPNPFNPKTTISYSLPVLATINMKVFDIRGQEVIVLQDEVKQAGNYVVQWNGCDRTGRPVNTGVYFCRLEAGSVSKTIKMLYLR